jgi:predicted porin
MKKTLVAIAALAVTSAFAQSAVTLTGNLDVAYGSVKVGTADAQKTISPRDLASSTSVINIIATEDLGGGVTSTAKYGIDPRKMVRDAATSPTVDEAFVGLAGGLGNVRLGSANSIGLETFGASTPFGTGIGGGYVTNVLGHTSNIRYVRSARYDSPAFSGVTVSVLKAQGASADVSQPTTLVSTTANAVLTSTQGVTEMGVKYANGPLNIAYANVKIDAWTTYKARSASTLGANYNMGNTTVYAGMTTGDDLSVTAATTTTKGSSLSVKQTIGQIDLLAGYNQRKNSDAASAQKLTGVRADYNFSKTTATYVGYENSKGADAVNDSRIVSIGLRKSF